MEAIQRAVKKLHDVAQMAIDGNKELEEWGKMFNTATNSGNIAQNEEGMPLSDGIESIRRPSSIRNAEKTRRNA